MDTDDGVVVRWRGEEYRRPWDLCSFKDCPGRTVTIGCGHNSRYVPTEVESGETDWCGEHLDRWNAHEFCDHAAGYCSCRPRRRVLLVLTPASPTVGLASSNGHAPDPQGASGPEVKKKKRVSPTLRSIWELKKRGVAYAVVERWIPGMKVKRDLFGCIDVLALSGGILGIQATTVANQAARMEKIHQEPKAALWCAAGGRLEVWGWARKWAQDARGRRRKLWVVTITPYTPGGERG